MPARTIGEGLDELLRHLRRRSDAFHQTVEVARNEHPCGRGGEEDVDIMPIVHSLCGTSEPYDGFDRVGFRIGDELDEHSVAHEATESRRSMNTIPRAVD